MPHSHLTTEAASARLRADLRTLMHDTEQLLKETASHSGEHAERLRARLKAALAAARQACHSLEAKAVAAAKSAAEVVRAHPYQSLGLAFGAGLLLGVLLRRK